MASQERFQLPTAETQRVTKTVTNSVAPAVRLPPLGPPPAENEGNIAQHEEARTDNLTLENG